VVALTLALLGCLGVGTAPSAAAVSDYLGISESSASWANPDTGTVHTFHWRFSVEWDGQWRYRSRTWCDYQPRGTSYHVAERCHFDMFHSALQVKYCAEWVDCPVSEPWGDADWEADGVTEKIWRGLPHAPGRDLSVRAITLHMQARFLVPNHLTQVYVGCSDWVRITGDHTTYHLPCSAVP